MSASPLVSFHNLPAEVLEQILAFGASEPSFLCRSACTCKILAEAVASSDHLWERLYRKRLTLAQVKKIPSFSRQGYVERHVRDDRALGRVLDIANTVAKKRHNGLGRTYQDPMWIQM